MFHRADNNPLTVTCRSPRVCTGGEGIAAPLERGIPVQPLHGQWDRWWPCRCPREGTSRLMATQSPRRGRLWGHPEHRPPSRRRRCPGPASCLCRLVPRCLPPLENPSPSRGPSCPPLPATPGPFLTPPFVSYPAPHTWILSHILVRPSALDRASAPLTSPSSSSFLSPFFPAELQLQESFHTSKNPSRKPEER